MPWSWADTEYSILRVQHSLSTAYIQDFLSSLHSHDYELTPECSLSFRCTSLHDGPPSASSPWGYKGKVTLSHSHSCKLTNWWIVSALGAPCIDSHQVLIQSRSITASKIISKPTRSQPPSVSPNSRDYGLQVSMIMASKCISPNSLNHDLEMHLQTRSIMASKIISKPTRSQPPSVSPNSPDYGLQVSMIMASKCISPNSLNHDLEMHLQTRSIAASKFTRAWLPSASPIMFDHDHEVHH